MLFVKLRTELVPPSKQHASNVNSIYISIGCNNYFLDEESAKYIDDWLGSNSEPRKKYIKDFKLDINRI